MSKDKDAAAPGVDANTLKENELARTIIGSGVKPENFRVDLQGGTATLHGTVKSEDDRRRVLDAARTVGGVAAVKDNLQVGGGTSSAGIGGSGGTGGGVEYTVKSGDTLSKIAKTHYGDASKYNRIFEANRNILSDPDKIQVGQVLTIPK